MGSSNSSMMQDQNSFDSSCNNNRSSTDDIPRQKRRSSLLSFGRSFKRTPEAGANPLDNGIPIKVSKKLYFGNMEIALVPDMLYKRYGVTHILNLCNSYKVPASDSGIVGYKQMSMSDDGDTNISEFMKEALTFIQEGMKKGKVFVHCRLGQNRSVTVMLAWLLLCERTPLVDAINMLKVKHATIKVHSNYMKQLSALEQEVLGRQSYLPHISSSSNLSSLIVSSPSDSVEAPSDSDSLDSPHPIQNEYEST